MAQTRSFQWLDDDLTKLLNQHMLGVVEPGVYRGFHSQHMPNNMALVLSHSASEDNGLYPSSYDEPPVAQGPYGVLMTRQGVVIKESTPITLPINAGDATYPRIDVITCRSAYTELAGGNAATYQVYTGTPSASPVAPVTAFPTEEIIIGTLYVPTGITTLDGGGVVWTRSVPPSFGRQLSTMYLDKEQTVGAIKFFEEIGLKAGAASLPAVDTGVLTLDTFNAFAPQWPDQWAGAANATRIQVTAGAATDYLITSMIARNAKDRVIILDFTGVGNKNILFHYDNFIIPEPQHNPPWNASSTVRRSLQVYDGDVVALVGMSAAGTSWKVLWVNSGKAARYDRRLIMEHSLILNRGGLVGGLPHFDWTANIIEIPSSGPLDVATLFPHAPDDSIFENILPPGYEVTFVPRYSGVGIATDKFRLMPGGNIRIGPDSGIRLPWNRPFTLIAQPSPASPGFPGQPDNCQWVLKNNTSALMQDITTAFLSNPTNWTVLDGTGTFVFGIGGSVSGVFYMLQGNVCTMSLSLYVQERVGTVYTIGVLPPAGMTLFATGNSSRVLAGTGIAGTTPMVAAYGGSVNNYIRIQPSSGVFEEGTMLQIRMSFEVYPAY